jgi:hypothetical protein
LPEANNTHTKSQGFLLLLLLKKLCNSTSWQRRGTKHQIFKMLFYGDVLFAFPLYKLMTIGESNLNLLLFFYPTKPMPGPALTHKVGDISSWQWFSHENSDGPLPSLVPQEGNQSLVCMAVT